MITLGIIWFALVPAVITIYLTPIPAKSESKPPKKCKPMPYKRWALGYITEVALLKSGYELEEAYGSSTNFNR